MNENQNDYVDINAHDNYPDSEQKIEIPTMKVIPLKKICMTLGELPTSYLETMTYYEMLIWFIEYLKNNIIPTVNNNAEAIQEVQSVVLALQNYINDYKDSIDSDVEELEEYMNNYFENLDVQEEINNKLDDMLEDGVLEQIIEQFLQLTSLICFDNVADMKLSPNLANGSYAKTLGYYSVNDGGKAIYKITNVEPINEYYETLNSGLYAVLIKEEYVKSKQFGIKGDNTDETLKLQTLLNNYDKVILNAGNYLITSSLTLTTTKELIGENGTVINASDSSDGLTQIIIVNNNSNVIIKNIKISGTMTGTGTFTGLRTNNSTKCYYENIEITGTSMGFYTTKSEAITFNRCYIHDTRKDGCTISDSSSNVTIQNCTAKNTGDDSFAVVSYNGDSNPTSNIKMINNTAIGCKKRSYLVDGGENIIISNNYALNGKNNLIAILGNSTVWNTRATNNIIVDSNVCELTDVSDLDDDIFVSLFGIQGASYVTFTNNRFDASSVVSTITRHNDNLMFQTNNVIIKNNYIDGAGVRFRQTTNLELSGNTIKHAYTHPIYVLSVNNMRIENNECYDYNVKNTSSSVFGVYCWTETVSGSTVRPSNLKIINNYFKTSNLHGYDVLLAYVDNAYIEKDPQSTINVDNSTNVSFGSLLITDLADTTLNGILTNGTIFSNANGILKVKTSTGINTITIA